MTRFTNRVALVTGAASGIGFEIARKLLEEGAIVYAGDLNPAAVSAGAIGLTLDVSSEVQFSEAIGRVIEERGRIDILCNNAGIGSTTDPVDCTVEEWDKVFAVNARGAFVGIKHTVPHMLRQGSGSIVNTASVAGMIGLRDRTAYSASKGAVIALTKQAAVQYASTGIRINCVCPGTVDSPWVGRLTTDAADPEAARAALIARQPMGRLGRPDEIAAAVLYLASDDAAFITGTELVIDGGIVAG